MTHPATLGGYGNLTADEADELTSLMVYGLDVAEVLDGEPIGAFVPLSILQAARFIGVRVKRARSSFTAPELRKLYTQKLDALRNGERARNIATAVQIRDHIGDDTAADRSVRLKAIATIEGHQSGVQINLNSTTNVDARQITPGYVIRLPAKGDSASPVNEALSRPAITLELLPEPSRSGPETVSAGDGDRE